MGAKLAKWPWTEIIIGTVFIGLAIAAVAVAVTIPGALPAVGKFAAFVIPKVVIFGSPKVQLALAAGSAVATAVQFGVSTNKAYYDSKTPDHDEEIRKSQIEYNKTAVEFNAKLKRNDEEIKRLTETLTALRLRIEESRPIFESQKEQLKNKLEQQDKEMEKVKTEMSRYRRDSLEARAENLKLREEFERFRRYMHDRDERQRNDLAQLTQQMNKTSASLMSVIDQQSNEIKNLTNIGHDLHTSLAAEKLLIVNQTEIIDVLMDERHKLNGILEKTKSNLNNTKIQFESRLDEYKDHTYILESNLLNTYEAYRNLTETFHDAKITYHNESEHSKQKVQILEELISRLTNEVQLKSSLLNNMTSVERILRGKLKNERRLLDNRTSLIIALEHEREELRQTLDNTTAVLQNMTPSLSQQMLNAGQTIVMLYQNLNETERIIGNISAQLVDLERIRVNETESYAQQQQELATLLAEKKTQQAVEDDLHNQVTTILARLNKAQQECNLLNETLQKFSKEVCIEARCHFFEGCSCVKRGYAPPGKLLRRCEFKPQIGQICNNVEREQVANIRDRYSHKVRRRGLSVTEKIQCTSKSLPRFVIFSLQTKLEVLAMMASGVVMYVFLTIAVIISLIKKPSRQILIVCVILACLTIAMTIPSVVYLLTHSVFTPVSMEFLLCFIVLANASIDCLNNIWKLYHLKITVQVDWKRGQEPKSSAQVDNIPEFSRDGIDERSHFLR